ncbi:hypothetical protein G8A07_06315 [Roseateles sp. DAIF2]|uniref:alpha/beta fold hydrolase n=1 Tax=Roseateles sp. DAIF2 TaxID=2714952 RepID=UPI0018A2DE96|nr:hypothetical protein [Roseateles sp. DAIF2]QPF72583.1 hypothetical protein G8A07_06315 [Roseateles sp. DAIF2]
MGGQYAQLFAKLYPEQAAGLVLVDALPPGALKPRGDYPWYTRMGLYLFASGQVQRELRHAPAIGAALLSQPGVFSKPVLRLVAQADPRAGKPEGLLKDLFKGVIYAEDFGVWTADPDVAERRLDQLYPQSTVQRIQTHHRVQEMAPELVLAAIRQVIERAGSTRD